MGRAVAVVGALLLGAVGVTACTGNDNGGVITPPPSSATSTTVASTSPTSPSTTGTLPNS